MIHHKSAKNAVSNIESVLSKKK